jgi:hypothetical protein
MTLKNAKDLATKVTFWQVMHVHVVMEKLKAVPELLLA